jgi:hypothetical protein
MMPLSPLVVLSLSAFYIEDSFRRERRKRGGGENLRERGGFSRGGSILGRKMVDSDAKTQIGKDLSQIEN